MKRFFFAGALIGAVAATMSLAVAQGDPGRPRPEVRATATSPKESADRALARAAQEAGLQTCRPLSDQVTRFLIGNNPSAGMLMAAPDNANVRIASASIEIEAAQGSMTYVSASYAPYGPTGCGVVYDAVTYWPESCPNLAARLSKELKPIGTLGNKLSMLDGGPTMRMFLMPAGAGCVQIKKEVVH